jgi:hypothetical protein
MELKKSSKACYYFFCFIPIYYYFFNGDKRIMATDLRGAFIVKRKALGKRRKKKDTKFGSKILKKKKIKKSKNILNLEGFC